MCSRNTGTNPPQNRREEKMSEVRRDPVRSMSAVTTVAIG